MCQYFQYFHQDSSLFLGLKSESLVTWFLVILGWCVIHWLTAKREDKKELRAIIKDSLADVEGLRTLSVSYHKNRTRNKELEDDIIWKIHRIDSKIQFLSEKLRIPALRLDELNEAITLNNFETHEFTQQCDTSDLIGKINWQSQKLINKLYSIF